jgi:hypothetical protein
MALKKNQRRFIACDLSDKKAGTAIPSELWKRFKTDASAFVQVKYITVLPSGAVEVIADFGNMQPGKIDEAQKQLGSRIRRIALNLIAAHADTALSRR